MPSPAARPLRLRANERDGKAFDRRPSRGQSGTVGLALQKGSAGHGGADLGSARKALARSSFGLILIDVGLPDGSGLDLAREAAAGLMPPILAFTAQDLEGEALKGIERVLVKSRTDRKVLVAPIEEALRMSSRRAS